MLTLHLCCHVQGIAKLDLLAPSSQKECAMATIEYADGARGGEAYFVPRSEAKGESKSCASGPVQL